MKAKKNYHNTFIKISIFMFCFFLTGFFCTTVSAKQISSKQSNEIEYFFWNKIAKRSAIQAWKMMGHKPLPKNSIVLTSAGYSVIDGYTTEACLDGLRLFTGSSAGKGSLISVHRKRNSPLWFFFYDKKTGYGVYCEINSSLLSSKLSCLDSFPPKKISNKLAKIPVDALYNILCIERINADYMLSNLEEWNENFSDKIFGGNEFSITTIVNIIEKNAPYDLIRSAMFHDHLCPGLTSGYLLANYIEEHFPIDQSSKYFYFSLPPWCKDDAIQILLNTTPGKRSYAVTYLTQEDKDRLKDEYQNIAGIFFRKNDNGIWEGSVLDFDFDLAREMMDIDWNGMYWWESRLLMNIGFLPYLETPETFISELKGFFLEEGVEPKNFANPGVDVLEEFGLVE
jgi:formylmethanofuran dehydrogenase subunit E-like metal-binding protein